METFRKGPSEMFGRFLNVTLNTKRKKVVLKRKPWSKSAKQDSKSKTRITVNN